MIAEIEDPLRLDKMMIRELGSSLSNSHTVSFKNVGSCLYNLRKINTRFKHFNIEENARCNFELLERGLLLRINDKQRFYSLILSAKDDIKVDLIKGEKIIILSIIGQLLCFVGVKRDWISKYWVFRRQIIYERLVLKIETQTELVELDSNGSNYNGAVSYFRQSAIQNKITIHNNK